MGDASQGPRRSTRQLLGKIPHYPGLYRHSVSGTYYGIKKIAGKRKEHWRKEHWLDTTDRKLAERRFKDREADHDEVDSEAESTTLAQLVGKFKKMREGTALKTRRAQEWILKSRADGWITGWVFASRASGRP